MVGYILQRLSGMIAVMLLVVTIVFVIVRVTPGDPAAVMLGPDATAQDVWLWPGSARMHGVNDSEADKAALAGCIAAALSETPGAPRPKSR